MVNRINLTENVNIKGGFKSVILHKEMKILYIVCEKIQIIHLVEYTIIFSIDQWFSMRQFCISGDIWKYLDTFLVGIAGEEVLLSFGSLTPPQQKSSCPWYSSVVWEILPWRLRLQSSFSWSHTPWLCSFREITMSLFSDFSHLHVKNKYRQACGTF